MENAVLDVLATDIRVAVGFAVCAAVLFERTSSSSGVVTCTMQEGLAGSFIPDVRFGAQGRAEAAAVPVTFELQLSDWGPRRGSMEGGTVLIFVGFGLRGGGASACESIFISDDSSTSPLVPVLHLSPNAMSSVQAVESELRCRVPASQARPTSSAALAAGGTQVMNVLAFGVDLGTFTYDAALTPVVDGLNPATLPYSRTATVTLTGSNLPVVDTNDDTAYNFSSLLTVLIGTRICDVTASRGTFVTCILAREQLENATYTVDRAPVPRVWVNNSGYAFRMLSFRSPSPSQASTRRMAATKGARI
jgi:hypothetical protein